MIMCKKLLVVDDDLPFRQMMVEFLESQGYEVKSAGDGDDGLSIFTVFAPDIVITDIQMPGKNGIQLAYDIMGTTPNTPIILISGSYDSEMDSSEGKNGISFLKQKSPYIYFLKKPFHLSKMLNLIREIEIPFSDNAA